MKASLRTKGLQIGAVAVLMMVYAGMLYAANKQACCFPPRVVGPPPGIAGGPAQSGCTGSTNGDGSILCSVVAGNPACAGCVVGGVTSGGACCRALTIVGDAGCRTRDEITHQTLMQSIAVPQYQMMCQAPGNVLASCGCYGNPLAGTIPTSLPSCVGAACATGVQCP